jgi:uncharacterized protein
MLAALTELVASIGLLQLLAIWSIVAFAAIMRAFTGFGFALTAVPGFSLFLPPSEAVVLSISLALAVSVLAIPTFWGKYPLKPLLPMIILSVVGTGFGTVVVGQISIGAFQLGIGVAVILACLGLSLYRPAQHQPSLWWSSVTGLASGLLNGAFAVPGPPVIIYAMATQPEPARSRALLMTFFLFSGLIGLTSYTVAGFVSGRLLWLFALAFPALYVGDKIGYYLFHRYGTALSIRRTNATFSINPLYTADRRLPLAAKVSY